jgi:hypothetical protein
VNLPENEELVEYQKSKVLAGWVSSFVNEPMRSWNFSIISLPK